MKIDDVIIRQATVKDRKEIWSFLELAYGERARYKFPDRWNWQYLNNPNWRNNNLPVWLAINNGRIIGQSNALFSKIKINKKIIYAGWSTDTVILPEYRGSGIGTRLQDFKLKNIKNYMAINIAFYNRRIMKKIGAHSGNKVTILKKYFSVNKNIIAQSMIYRTRKNKIINKLISLSIKFFFIHIIISFILNKLFIIRNKLKQFSIKQLNQVEIVEISKFDKQIDQLWERVKNDYDICSVRKHEQLNWKFHLQPDVDYRFFLAKKGKEVCGYSILRKCVPPEKKKLVISDLFGRKNDSIIFRALINHAVNLFKDEIPSIECATSINSIKQELIKNGFVISEVEIPMFYSGVINNWKKILEKKDSWFLSKSSSDWDQYHIVNNNR